MRKRGERCHLRSLLGRHLTQFKEKLFVAPEKVKIWQDAHWIEARVVLEDDVVAPLRISNKEDIADHTQR